MTTPAQVFKTKLNGKDDEKLSDITTISEAIKTKIITAEAAAISTIDEFQTK